MKLTAIGLICAGAALLSPVTAVRAASERWEGRKGHVSGVTARITLPDGTRRTVQLEGVGCSLSICSRTAIEGKEGNQTLVQTRFDSLAAIRDPTATHALFVLKDGTERRLSLLKDFRVLYLANRSGGTEKLDLAGIKSIEFGGASKAAE